MHQPVVSVLDLIVEPDVDLVRHVMVERHVNPAQQVDLWIDLYMQHPDPDWGEKCLAEAERVKALLARIGTLRGSRVPAPEALTPAPAPQDADFALRNSPAGIQNPESGFLNSTSQFVWLGDRLGYTREMLRDAISRLASVFGLIATDDSQQAALRRALGVAVNATERSTAAPRVVWLGGADHLAILVDGLFRLGAIACPDGSHDRWRTAAAIFSHPDGSPYRTTLRNSLTSRPDRVDPIDRAILASVRRVASVQAKGSW